MQILKSVLYSVVLSFEDNKQAIFAGSLNFEFVMPLIARLSSKEKNSRARHYCILCK